MPVAFSRMQQTTVLPVSKGLMIQCPASGLVLPLSESPEPAAAAGYLGEGVLLHLQGNQLVAPFAGLCSRQDQAGQQLRFHHANTTQMAYSWIYIFRRNATTSTAEDLIGLLMKKPK